MNKLLKKHRIIVITLLVACLTAGLGIVGISYLKKTVSNRLIDVYEQQEQLLAHQVASGIEDGVADIQRKLEIMAVSPEIINSDNTAVCNAKLQEFLKITDRHIGNLGRVNAKGTFACSVNSQLVGVPAKNLGSYIGDLIADPEHHPVTSRMIKPPGITGYAIALHVPVYRDKQFAGTIGGAIYIDEVKAKYLQDVHFSKNGFAFLLDNNGDIVYHQDADLIGKNIKSPDVKQRYLPQDALQFVSSLKAGDTGKLQYSLDGTQKVAAYEAFGVPGRNMVAFVTVPLNDVHTVITSVGINTSFLLIILILTGSIGLLTFLTLYQQHQSERLQAAKDEFVSLASHQLRTPATGVKTFLGILREGYSGDMIDEQRKMIDKAYDSNERQLMVIDDLLNVARLDAGRMQLHMKSVDLVEMIQSVIGEQAGTMNARQQTVTFNAPSSLVIQADPDRLRMAIENLLSNAGKYSPVGSTIIVALRTQADQVLIDVQDNGIGISQADISKLFKKFSRIDNRASATTPGTGLGLYLCYEIVRLHNGNVEVKSQLGKGSLFTIKLPLRKDEHA